MHENVENSKKSIGQLGQTQPYWPQLNMVNHHDELHMNDNPNPICHPANMWVTSKWIDMHSKSPPMVVVDSFTSIRINGNVNWLMENPSTLVPQSKLEYGAILPTQLARNPPKVGHFPICMHTYASTCGL